MRISQIVAATSNHVIGIDNDLPWHLPDDMQFFKEQTKGHHILMGRKNFESIPMKFRPLPNRVNIVLTRTTDYEAEGVEVVHTIEEGVNFAENAGADELYIIGGAEVYAQTIDRTDRIYLTEIDTTLEGDAYFPEINKDEWVEVERRHHPIDERHKYAFDFVIYDRKK